MRHAHELSCSSVVARSSSAITSSAITVPNDAVAEQRPSAKPHIRGPACSTAKT